jgi:hypothetical protein
MAKRKHAAALFEVIHHDKRFKSRHSTWSWPTMKWWPFARCESSRRAAESRDPSGPSLLARLFALLPPMPRIALESDPERQEVRFRLSYTAAVVSGFTIVVAMVLSFMIGRHGARPVTPALAEQTTEELRAGPVQPGVLDVGGAVGEATSPTIAMATQEVPARPANPPATPQKNTTANSTANPQAMRPSHWTEPRGPATLMVSDSKRTVGLQYVVIQSYPPEEEKFAKATVDLLNSNGVLCTMETGIPYAPRWICVVGVTGFNRIRNSPEYDAYIAKIKQIEAQAGGSSKFLKKLDPKPYPWKDAAKAKSE